MTLDQTPGAVALMLAAELVSLGRIVACRSPVTHSGQFSRGEQLQLPHAIIIAPTTDKFAPSIAVRSCQIADSTKESEMIVKLEEGAAVTRGVKDSTLVSPPGARGGTIGGCPGTAPERP
jgi:hypothetical protein